MTRNDLIAIFGCGQMPDWDDIMIPWPSYWARDPQRLVFTVAARVG